MTDLEELTIETELEQQSDRWIAEVIEIPGVLVYGSSEVEAIDKAKALALRVLAERLEHGEPTPGIEKLFRHQKTSNEFLVG
jgi:predicted RNase H-like HicB family nuclease